MPVLDLTELAENIEWRKDGLWLARTSSRVSYPSKGNDYCFAVEEESFWFQHRNQCILEMLRRFPPAGTFFDIGGGNGYVARGIQESGREVVLVEPGLTGARNALRRGIRNVLCATLQDAGFRPGTLPAAGLFDVVEHIEHDREFLAGIHRLLAPAGRVYLTVPAFGWLWSHEDRAAGHWRRYTARTLVRVLSDAGYEVEFATCFFSFLPLPILLMRALPFRLGLGNTRIEARKMQSDHHPSSSVAVHVLETLCRRERGRIAAGRPRSWGASILAVARKLS